MELKEIEEKVTYSGKTWGVIFKNVLLLKL